MRLRTLLMMLLAVAGFLGTQSAAHASTTPTEAAALAAAEHDHTAYTLPPGKLARAEALEHTGYILTFGRLAWGLLVLVCLLHFGIAARMRDLALRLSPRRWLQGFAFCLQFLLLTTLLSLPFSLYGHHVSVAYGLSVQSWASWFGDLAKTFLITYGLGGSAVVLLFLFYMRWFPRRWWLAAALTTMLFTLIGVFITPYVVDPVFNRFEPLSQSNPALVTQLERVVARGNGIRIPPDRMFLMKASSKTTTMNAYVTGFGASKRVVVWDTSVSKGTTDEILQIFGHEMGHYVLGHIVSGILFSFLLMLIGFPISFYLFQWLLRRFGPRWRIPTQPLPAQQDWAALVVLVLVMRVVAFLGEPIANAYSRADEHAADVYGQEVVHGIVADPQATGQQSFQLLGENSYDVPDPSPAVDFWLGTHPPTWLRAAFARHYDPWVPGATPKYFSK